MASLTRVTTKKPVIPKAPSITLDVQYPLKWFEDQKTKPTLDLVLILGTLEKSRSALRKAITDNSVGIDVCKAFLYHFALTIKEKLPEDWISYGMTIGVKGALIGPMDLLDVKKVETLKEIEGITTAIEDDDPWMAGYILSIYRLIRTSISEYKNQMAKRITTQLRALKSTAPEMTDVVDIYSGWASDKGYNTMVAAFDMFFQRFPHHKYANFRIGTIGSRFRDCSALLSYGYINNLLGMEKLTDVMDWVFVEQIGTDIDRMMLSGDELTEQHSYFPYHVDMGLVLKSAYSASANPHFFEWVHTIGSLMKSPRSMNAAHVFESRLTDITINAACVAYAYSSNVLLTKVYTETGDPLALVDDDGSSGEEDAHAAEDVIKTRDPTNWCTLLSTLDGDVPKPVKRHMKKIIDGITDPRVGTIAENLVNLAPTLY